MLTDSNGCTTTSNTYVITEPTQIQNVAVVTPVSCFGGSNDGSIDITTSGVFPSILIYGVMVIPMEDISGLSSGTYLIETTDIHQGIIDTFMITEPTPFVC